MSHTEPKQRHALTSLQYSVCAPWQYICSTLSCRDGALHTIPLVRTQAAHHTRRTQECTHAPNQIHIPNRIQYLRFLKQQCLFRTPNRHFVYFECSKHSELRPTKQDRLEGHYTFLLSSTSGASCQHRLLEEHTHQFLPTRPWHQSWGPH